MIAPREHPSDEKAALIDLPTCPRELDASAICHCSSGKSRGCECPHRQATVTACEVDVGVAATQRISVDWCGPAEAYTTVQVLAFTLALPLE
jgi:hypothetical protein